MANNPFLKAMQDITGKGAHGIGDLPAAFAPFLEQFRKENLSWLSMPAFGLAREHQEHYQRTALAFVEYQEALRNYNLLLLKASQRGLEMLESKLGERSEPGRAIDSPRALYDLWVDAAEDAYAEIALSDEFSKAYGALANAQMRMRSQIQAEVERIGTDLGMPTRTELNSVHQRLHALRREFRDERGGSAVIADLEAEIAELRVEIDKLKAPTGVASPSASKPAKPAPAAKATSSIPVTAKPKAPEMTRAPAPTARKATPKRRPAAKSNDTRARVKAPRSAARVKAAAQTKAAPAQTAPPQSIAAFGDAIAARRKLAAQTAGARSRGRTRRTAPRVKSAAATKAAPAQKTAPAQKPVPLQKNAAPSPIASFGDAIAAMRKRVAKRGPAKAAAARFAWPQKAGKSSKSSRKKNKRR